MDRKSFHFVMTMAAVFVMLTGVMVSVSLRVQPATADLLFARTSTPVRINLNRDGRTHRANLLSGLTVGSGGGAGVGSCEFENDRLTVSYEIGENLRETTTASGQQFDMFIDEIVNVAGSYPVLCSPVPISPSSGYAISPLGIRYDANFRVRPPEYDPDDDRYAVRLPVAAYAQPGNWILGINDPEAGVYGEIIIRVPQMDRPFYVYDYVSNFDPRETLELLGGFAPHEHIVAVRWELQQDLSESTIVELTADAAGLIWFDNSPNAQAFVGEYGGVIVTGVWIAPIERITEAIPSEEYAPLLWQAFWGDDQSGSAVAACPGAKPPRMIVGGRGRNAFGYGTTSVRARPQSQTINAALEEGEEFTVLDGPTCTEAQRGHLNWWYIETDYGVTGWVPEGYDDDVYWIEPL